MEDLKWSEEQIVLEKKYGLRIKKNGVIIGSITNHSDKPITIYIQRYVVNILIIFCDNGRFYQIWCDKYEIKRID